MTTHTPRPPYAFRGFTLLELLIVLAVVALLAALVAPRIGSGEAALFRAQVRESVAALNYARRSAIIQGRPKEVRLSEGEVAGGRRVSRGASVSVVEDAAGPDVAERAFVVTFFPGGGSSGGTFSLRRGEYGAEIRVDEITGRVTARILGEEAT